MRGSGRGHHPPSTLPRKPTFFDVAGGLALDAVLGFEWGDVTRPVNFNDPTQPVEPADSSGRLVVITAAFFREPFE